MRLNAVFDDLDVTAEREVDARIDLVKGLYAACGEVLVAINQLEPKRSSVSAKTLAAAKEAMSRAPQ